MSHEGWRSALALVLVAVVGQSDAAVAVDEAFVREVVRVIALVAPLFFLFFPFFQVSRTAVVPSLPPILAGSI